MRIPPPPAQITSPPAQRSEVGGVARPAGGGPAACCTQRRPNNTRVRQFTSPLPILLSLDRPPPASLGEEVLKPPLPRSEAKWEGSAVRPGEGSPRIALNAVPKTPASVSTTTWEHYVGLISRLFGSTTETRQSRTGKLTHPALQNPLRFGVTLCDLASGRCQPAGTISVGNTTSASSTDCCVRTPEHPESRTGKLTHPARRVSIFMCRIRVRRRVICQLAIRRVKFAPKTNEPESRRIPFTAQMETNNDSTGQRSQL